MRPKRTLSALVLSTTPLAAFALVARSSGQPPARGAVAPSQPPAVAATLQRGEEASPVAVPFQEPSDIAWGAGREVQAGLRVRLWATSQHAARFIFDVYLRNPTKHTLHVTCPSFAGLCVPTDADYSTLVQSDSIYCSPHLRDSNGRAVDVDFHLGTQDRQYTIEPGQVVYVSHWMLRTMGRGAQETEKAKYTQVAFVEPGKHRMTCDVSAGWGSKGERRTRLRTGEVAFDVTAVDVAAE